MPLVFVMTFQPSSNVGWFPTLGKVPPFAGIELGKLMVLAQRECNILLQEGGKKVEDLTWLEINPHKHWRTMSMHGVEWHIHLVEVLI